ncbi:uncharacterized protein LOC143213035 [Lasioglossum baleicum]|uniref:uncharacterized protein LOC143213035 n=1 Tax=Lasioglossum baleicum TaxID=434251 RepID=UPI003FCDFCDF
MESPTQEKDEQDMEKIYVDLEQLKKRINHFIYTVEGDNAGEPKKIKTLTTKTQRLLVQHKQVKEELQRYENEYRKALMKNAKILKRTLKRDERKLEDLKEKCKTQGVQVEVAMLKMNRNDKEPKKTRRPIEERSDKRVIKGKYSTIKDKIKIKMRTKNKPAGRNIFKQKSTRRSDNIKIQIQKNKETGERELFFFNSSNAKERFSNLMQQKEVKSNNFRECRIMLQKLTEEQAKKYTDKKNPEQRKVPRKSQESLPDNSIRKSSGVEPNWQIRIPKAVLEESQSDLQKMSNTSDVASGTKRPRSPDKQAVASVSPLKF